MVPGNPVHRQHLRGGRGDLVHEDSGGVVIDRVLDGRHCCVVGGVQGDVHDLHAAATLDPEPPNRQHHRAVGVIRQDEVLTRLGGQRSQGDADSGARVGDQRHVRDGRPEIGGEDLPGSQHAARQLTEPPHGVGLRGLQQPAL
jgi:hypothetical protein